MIAIRWASERSWRKESVAEHAAQAFNERSQRGEPEETSNVKNGRAKDSKPRSVRFHAAAMRRSQAER